MAINWISKGKLGWFGRFTTENGQELEISTLIRRGGREGERHYYHHVSISTRTETSLTTHWEGSVYSRPVSTILARTQEVAASLV